LTPDIYKLAHLTYKLLLHYLGKCKTSFFISIQQRFLLNR